MSFGAIHARPYPLLPSSFAVFTLFLLSGYALFGRGFAYVGVPPVFVGEFGLCLAVMVVLSGLYRGLLQSSLTWLIILFMLWGAVRTLPYFDSYGLNALRDGAVWGYALYSIATANVVLRLKATKNLVFLFDRWIPVFLLLVPVLEIIWLFGQDFIPRWPWGPEGVQVIFIKMGDLAVHYSGIFVFVVLGLSNAAKRVPWVFLWFLGVIPAMMLSRGALVTIGFVIWLGALVRPSLKYFYTIFLGGFFLILFYLLGMEFATTMGWRRDVSIEQLVLNIQSILFPTGRSDLDLEGTRLWRELWWNKICDYTIFGDYFWTGKGFGINLADADGFQVLVDRSLRSPHNIHMTILARAGVPGLVLWTALQLTFGVKLFVSSLRDRRAHRPWLASVEIWVLLYWLAFMLNGSFDVFLEGPQGGIWFWTVFGFGLALMMSRKDLTRSTIDSSGMLRDQESHIGTKPRRANPLRGC